MLGRYADAFFRKQMNENVVAGSPNGLAESIAFPDRERAGTGKVQRVSGHYEMPGPQNMLSGNAMVPGMNGDAMPGMGAAAMMPGMNGDAMPGMGAGTMPGMGALSQRQMVMLGVVGVGGFLAWRMLGSRKARQTKARRSSRRRSAGRRRRDALGRYA